MQVVQVTAHFLTSIWELKHGKSEHPCPLCEEAKVMLEPYKHKFILQEIDITLPDHSVWLEKYKYEIPVFHLNGKFLMKHRVDIQKLENQLLNLELQDESSK
ncbi:glutaredoxin-like protein C5orf63 homolog isoform X2 [Candoia aspera]|uniref:glutaredoxin-like protein C5orf63 homolog isoform X2 n=1 Tax=Candoia aspera TaxID=51853 RepID=UPI002FD8148D